MGINSKSTTSYMAYLALAGLLLIGSTAKKLIGAESSVLDHFPGLCARYFAAAERAMDIIQMEAETRHPHISGAEQKLLNEILLEARNNGDKEVEQKIAIIYIGLNQRRYQVIARKVNSTSLCLEDKMNEVNSHLFSIFGKYNPTREQFGTYSYQAARRHLWTIAAKKCHRTPNLIGELSPFERGDSRDKLKMVEGLVADETATLLIQALRDYKEVNPINALIVAKFHGLLGYESAPIKDIAAELNISTQAVNLRKLNAYRDIGKILVDSGYIDEPEMIQGLLAR